MCGEHHLRLAVLDDEQLVFADVPVAPLNDRVSSYGRQIFAGRVLQCHAGELSDRLHLHAERRVASRLVDEHAVAVQETTVARPDAVATFTELELEQRVAAPRDQLGGVQRAAVRR